MPARIFVLQETDGAAIESLLSQGAEIPWPGLHQASEFLGRSVLRQRIRQRLEASDGRRLSLAAGRGGASDFLHGFVQLGLLDWDSELLGVPCARLECLQARGAYAQQRRTLKPLLSQALAWLANKRVRMVHVRVPVLAIAAIHSLEDAGFRFVAGVSCFYRPPGNLAASLAHALRQRFVVRRSRRSDLAHIQAFAAGAFQRNRFSLDPNLDSRHVDRLYASWISNALQRKNTRLIVCERQRRPIAFLLYELQRYAAGKERFRLSRLVLAASADAERSRGAALACLLYTMKELQGRADVLEAVVGSTNEAACRALRRFGFHCLNRLIDLHAWL